MYPFKHPAPRSRFGWISRFVAWFNIVTALLNFFIFIFDGHSLGRLGWAAFLLLLGLWMFRMARIDEVRDWYHKQIMETWDHQEIDRLMAERDRVAPFLPRFGRQKVTR